MASDLDLDAIEARSLRVGARWYVHEADGPWAHVLDAHDDAPICAMDGGLDEGVYEAARDLIAHAPTDIAALLAEVRRLRAMLPTGDEREALGAVIVDERPLTRAYEDTASAWLARLDAARAK